MTRRRLPPPPAVVGIVNVTPDSFSDGGAFLDPGRAIEHGLRLLDEGAAALDLGAESTRPGAAPVAPDDEQRRLLPVLRGLRALTDAPLSVDTRRAETARLALDEGCDVVNDVSMLREEPALATRVAEAGALLVLMHSRGSPQDMQRAPRYVDVVREVIDELRAALDVAAERGCGRDSVLVDPGFGFAKSLEHNLELLRGLSGLLVLGRPILVGVSRKSFVGTVLGPPGGPPRPVGDRVAGSVGAALACRARGATYFRVHDVRPHVDALRLFEAAQRGEPGIP